MLKKGLIQIDISFYLDLNGILFVKAKEKLSQIEKEIQISLH